ncbi:MAG: translocation/assembly module TamB domain-containing protein [Bacteroidales bacterium]|nr:translocation/assembly module TamB domain-containing protein [Bacteroidales bacterium]
MKRLFKIIGVCILVLVLLVLLVPALLYVPLVQDMIVRRGVPVVSAMLPDMSLNVGRIRLRYPLQIELRDVLVRSAVSGDTLAYVHRLRTGLDDYPREEQPFWVVNSLEVDGVVSRIDSGLVSGLDLNASLDSLTVRQFRLDLEKQLVLVDDVLLKTPAVRVVYQGSEQEEDTTQSAPWSVQVRQLDLRDGFVTYDRWNLDSLQVHVEQFRMFENRLLHIDTLNVGLPESRVGLTADVDLAFLIDSSRGFVKTNLQAVLSRSDLMLIAADALPNLRQYWPEEAGAELKLSAYATPDTCRIDSSALHVGDYVDLQLCGSSLHPFDHARREADIRLDASLCEADSLLSALYQTPDLRDYHLPGQIRLHLAGRQQKSAYRGRIEVSQTDSLPVVLAEGGFDEKTYAYDVEASVQHLNLADYYTGPELSDINLNALASGRYFDFGKRRTSLQAEVRLDSLVYTVENDSVHSIDTFRDVSVEASLLKGAYRLHLHSGMTLAQGDVQLAGLYLNDTLSAKGDIQVSVPEVGNFDSVMLDFRSEPQLLKLNIQGGDALVNLEADCGLDHLAEVADRVSRELDVQTTNKAFDINALQRYIPHLTFNVNMHRQNPLIPVLAHYGVSFDQANVLLINSDSLHLDADIDTLCYDQHSLAHIDAHLVPKDGDYDYLAHVVYPDTITNLSYTVNTKARLQSKLISAQGTILADTFQIATFDATMAHRIEAEAQLTRLPLAVINQFLPQSVTLDGFLNGHAVLDCDSVDFNALVASLWFDSAHVWYEGCDMTLGLPSDSIVYRDGVLSLDHIGFETETRQPIVVDGKVDLRRDMQNPDIDLQITADKTRLFKNNRRRTRGQFLFGKLPFTAAVAVRGRLNDLKVNGQLQIPSGCDLTYYYENDDLAIGSQLNDLVEFKSFEEIVLPVLEPGEVRPPLKRKETQQLEVNLKIRIDKSTQVLVYLPTSSDDRIQVMGGGDFLLGLDESGKIRLTGVYEVASGDINFKLPMLPMTKEFALNKDGYVRWSGVPDEPELYLTASQPVKCTINDVSSGARVVKFVVSVIIRGTLENMDVEFDCSAPDDAAIQSELATLTDEDRTRQALLLLVAQTYSGPSASSGNAGMASANAVLNSLLNKEIESLLTNKMKHTEINVGIDTYDATGTGVQQTDYSVSVSQKLFNDRMRVTVGGKVSTGDEVRQNDANIINDVSMEWMINKDGSHYARVFRKVNYQSVLEGEVVETGVGYVQQRSAFRFWQLFIPTSKKRAAARAAMMQKLQREAMEADRAIEADRTIETIDSINTKATEAPSATIPSAPLNNTPQ